MIVYRISDCRYIQDLSGKGAALYGGRWNNKDTYMLYTAQSPSLALLEAVVHLGKLPRSGYCMATIELPDSITPVFAADKLPGNWDTNPAPDILKTIGDNFIRSGKYLAMPVPSVIMPEEYNYLINPLHSLFDKVKIIHEKQIRIDERIFNAVA